MFGGTPDQLLFRIAVAMSARDGWPMRLCSQRISLTRVVSMMCLLMDCARAEWGGIDGAHSTVDDAMSVVRSS
jgi:hypothetical protein